MTGSDEYILEGWAATTGELTGRTFRLSMRHLEDIRDGLLDGSIGFGLDHDTRAALPARVLDAVIKEVNPGEYGVRARWSVSKEVAEKFGDRQGLSIGIFDEEVDGWDNPDNPDIRVSPDCYWWSDDEIVDALKAADTDDYVIGGGRLILLAGEPPAKIVIDLLTDPYTAAGMAAVAVEIVTRLLDSLRKKKKAAGTKLLIDVRRRRKLISFETDDSKSAEALAGTIARAIERLGEPWDDEPTGEADTPNRPEEPIA